MQVKLGFGAVAGLALAAVGAFVVWRGYSAASGAADALSKMAAEAAKTVRDAAAEAVDAVNPTSANNLAYRGVNAGLTAAAGSPTFVSDAIFSVFNPQARAAERDMLDPVPAYESLDDEDAALGQAMSATTVTPGGAYIGYGAAFGKRRR